MPGPGTDVSGGVAAGTYGNINALSTYRTQVNSDGGNEGDKKRTNNPVVKKVADIFQIAPNAKKYDK